MLGRIINKFKPANSFIKILSETLINRKSKILDIGSGSGSRLMPLINAGFNILAIEPYLKKEKIETNGLRILKKNIYQIDGQWDLIMLNHVFEHLENPQKILLKINDLLSPNGKCLIRTPVIPSFAWEKYLGNWVQIDAPRHFFIHSPTSIALLAKQTNLTIEKVIYDSTPFQFLGSELYKRNIAMKKGDFRLTKENTQFSIEELDFFINKTQELNKNRKGDQAAFILSKKNYLE
jgi:SAM-dependent methyltransferase